MINRISVKKGGRSRNQRVTESIVRYKVRTVSNINKIMTKDHLKVPPRIHYYKRLKNVSIW